jgi:amino acid adenylation domain-containing protein
MTQGFQLSPRQKHLWLLQPDNQLDVFYTEGTLNISGTLNLPSLQEALATVVNEHEILRTLFDFPPALSIPVQVILDAADLTLPYQDLAPLQGEAQAERANEIMVEIRREKAVNQAPVFYAVLFRLSKFHHQLRIWLPALTADVGSFMRMADQLTAAYATVLADANLEIETLQYADFSEWQHELLDSEEAEVEGEEWYRKLLSAPLDIHLPLEFEPETEDIFIPAAIQRVLDSRLYSLLSDMANKHDIAVSTILLAAWRILLWRLGHSELVLGLGCDGRTYEELENAIGLFDTTLPLPTRLDGDEKLPDLLKTLEDSVVGAFESQEYFSWERMPQVGGEDPRRHYFPVAFNYHDILIGNFQVEAVMFSIESLSAVTNRFHLLLDCYHQENELTLTLRYDSRRFDTVDVERQAERLITLLENMVANPDAAVQDLSILPQTERKKLLQEFSRSTSLPPASIPVHHLIAAQAKKRPDETAVTLGYHSLTYGELDKKSTQLAVYLQSLGVKADVPVGLLLNATPDAVAAILAVMKAGGAYVPLDPQYPPERVAFVLDDNKTPVLITDSASADIKHGTANVIQIDAEDAYPETTEQPKINDNFSLDDLAYLIYTSGSTGQPKGVAVSHHNLAHSTTTRFEQYENQPKKFLLLSSFAFDSSVVGLFWTLSQGGTLVLATAEQIRDPQTLADLIEKEQITHTLALPSLYQLLLTEADPEQLASLETVIVAGESCPPFLVYLHQERLPGVALFNEYGPTEGTVWCTVFDCRQPVTRARVPIGRPIPNTEIYILDVDQQPAPIGVPGELHIGGPGVAQGYYKRPELTAERFINHLFSDDLTAKLYRTGDLVRFLPDGNIEFLGREDQQIKIRGYRVELGEVEHVLIATDAVQEAAITVREDKQGLLQLTAYVTTSRETNPLELRDYLSQKLPPYMVPADFVFLGKMPRTLNGKINRQALPDPDGKAGKAAAAYVEPSTALEKVLIGVWSELLNYEPVGLNDNFFNLGGHSILVTQLVGRLRSLLPVDLPLRIIFDKPTIAELSAHILSEADDTAEIETTAELLLQVAELSDEETEEALNAI